jgi:mono/diheme cytochrome c family protein
VLPATLAETGLFDPNRPAVVDARHRPFAPQYPLWSDGMTKRRWLSLPPDTTVDAQPGRPWDFPVGTRFWKEFSLVGRRVETRILWKTSAAGWIFGSYLWNDEGTAAALAPDDGIPGAVEVAPGRRYSIPSRAECQTCHGTARFGPLGFNELQLSPDRDPNAIHGEPLAPGMLTLRTLIDEQLLSPGRADLAARPPRIRASSPSTRAVLGYLAANCGSCHDGSASVSVLGPSLTVRDLLADGDAVARSLIGRPSKWQVPGHAGDDSVLVHAGAPELSTMLLRMRSRSPSSQMPPLGTVLRDEQAVAAISAWIATEAARLP